MVTSKGNVIIQLLSGRSNVFIIIAPSGKAILVDTSIKMMRDKLMAKLMRQGISRPDYLVLTHNHFDHAGNAGYIRQQTGTKVVIHQSEARELEQGVMKIPAGTLAVTRALVRLADTLEVDLAADPCPADITFTDSIEFPGFDGIKVIHNPRPQQRLIQCNCRQRNSPRRRCHDQCHPLHRNDPLRR